MQTYTSRFPVVPDRSDSHAYNYVPNSPPLDNSAATGHTGSPLTGKCTRCQHLPLHSFDYESRGFSTDANPIVGVRSQEDEHASLNAPHSPIAPPPRRARNPRGLLSQEAGYQQRLLGPSDFSMLQLDEGPPPRSAGDPQLATTPYADPQALVRSTSPTASHRNVQAALDLHVDDDILNNWPYAGADVRTGQNDGEYLHGMLENYAVPQPYSMVDVGRMNGEAEIAQLIAERDTALRERDAASKKFNEAQEVILLLGRSLSQLSEWHQKGHQ
ncbi:hypothetical protein BV25DRAFT_1915293 [Artomyces pyxidatus]|uniref:Uncharacterized protein n=1 Tax=Artomyces pyxidatus TaxID=48021 RepID=A0ACB8T4K3_9AGAM|nr:hypothetical protein BV25DRAFT_1915293 [Artomyces pyxidatus]